MDDQEKGGRAHSIVSDSAETLCLWVLNHAVGLGASVLIARGLGPEGRGEYYLPVVAAATMVAICKLGLEQANVFLLGTRGLSIDRLSGQNGLVAVVAGMLGVVLLLLAPSVLRTLFADTPVFLLLLGGLVIPFSLHTQLSAGMLTLRGQVTWQFRAGLFAGVIQVVLLLGLLVFGWFHVGPVLAVNLAVAIATWGFTVGPLRASGATWVRWDKALLGQTLTHSLMLHVGMVLFFLHLRLDMFMVKAMVGTAALGQYSIAVVLAETLLLATDSLAIAILPRQVGNTLGEAASLALRGTRTSALLGIGAALLQLARSQPRTHLRNTLSTLLPGKVAEAVLARRNLRGDTTMANLSREDRRTLVQALLEWPLPVAGGRGYNFAEVTAGGVPLTEVDPSTLESRRCPGLYFTGEILDVDGRLGGFNFQWAWSSAWVVASALARA